jgi:hypothetical protein
MRITLSLLIFSEMKLWILVNALLVDNFTALLAGTLAQIEKQLKLIPYSLSDFKHKA